MGISPAIPNRLAKQVTLLRQPVLPIQDVKLLVILLLALPHVAQSMGSTLAIRKLLVMPTLPYHAPLIVIAPRASLPAAT